MIFVLLALASTAPQAGANSTTSRTRDRGPFATLVSNEKFDRVRAVFPQAKYVRFADYDCLLTADTPKPGCKTLEIQNFSFGDDADYSVKFEFDGNDHLQGIRLVATDHEASKALDRGVRLQRLLRNYYGSEYCNVAASCSYGSPPGPPITSSHPTLASLSVDLSNFGDHIYITSIGIDPRTVP